MLRVVLPKGSLEKATFELFEAADLQIVRSSSVDYRATIDDPRVAEVRILRPQEIPVYVAEGLFDIGITGRDWVEETSHIMGWNNYVKIKQEGKGIQGVMKIKKIIDAFDQAGEDFEKLNKAVNVFFEAKSLTARHYRDLNSGEQLVEVLNGDFLKLKIAVIHAIGIIEGTVVEV